MVPSFFAALAMIVPSTQPLPVQTTEPSAVQNSAVQDTVQYKANVDRSVVVSLIDQAIERQDLDAARAAIATLGASWQATQRDLSTLGAMKQARDVLAFNYVKEAELPAGWPPVTPAGEIELKHYPSYRLAKVDSATTQGRGMFWQLFGHIQKNSIPMTAPVEMEMKTVDNGMEMQSMAFLYESTEQGALGRDGNVLVEEVAPFSAITIGMRGDSNLRDVRQAAELLRKHLETNYPDYVVSGPLRVLGYNSPSVPASRKFYEVQLPVAKKP